MSGEEQNNNHNINAQEGTPEYTAMMRQYYGEEYDRSIRTSFIKRVGAYIIDGVFSTMISLIVLFTTTDFSSMIGSIPSSSDPDFLSAINSMTAQMEGTSAASIMGLTSIVTSLIIIVCEIYFSASPGKLLLKLKIAKAGGQEASKKDLTLRALVKYSAALVQGVGVIIGVGATVAAIQVFATLAGVIVFIGYFLALGDSRKALHDILPNTTVYDVEDVIPNV